MHTPDSARPSGRPLRAAAAALACVAVIGLAGTVPAQAVTTIPQASSPVVAAAVTPAVAPARSWPGGGSFAVKVMCSYMPWWMCGGKPPKGSAA